MAHEADLVDNPAGTRVYHVGIGLGVLTTVAVLLRLLARWRTKAKFDVDDYLVVISLIPFYIMTVLSYIAVKKGHFGLPMSKIDASDITELMKIFMASNLTYSLTITMVKISILLLYRRIFNTATFRLKTLIVGLICISWFFIVVFTDIFQCRPMHAAFEYSMLFSKSCINIQAYYIGISISNVLLDLVVLYLPIHEVWKLQLPKQKKLMLSGVFTLGGVVCIAGIMRTVTLSNLKTADFTVTLVPEYAWSEAEPGLAIICACIVTYRPLFSNLKLDLSKVSSIFSRKDKSSTDASTSDISWAGKEDVDLRIPQLSAKAAERGLHVVHVNLGVAGSPPMENPLHSSEGGGSRCDKPKSSSKGSKPKYRSPPFAVEGEAPVVDPWV